MRHKGKKCKIEKRETLQLYNKHEHSVLYNWIQSLSENTCDYNRGFCFK